MAQKTPMRPDAYLGVPTAMSVNRSNSQVRNLLAMFENNNSNNTNNNNNTSTDSTSPDRGRSNGHLSPSFNADRPLSKIRSSFVSVEHAAPTTPTPAMDIDPQKTKDEYQQRQESSASLRRHSFSLDESRDGGAIANLRQSMTQEEERRGSNPMVAETIPEAAIEQTPAVTTPAVEAKDYMAAGHIAHGNGDLSQSKLRDAISADDMAEDAHGSKPTQNPHPQAMTLPADDMPADKPDKPVSGVQEEAGEMQPSDLKVRSTVSPTPGANAESETAPVELPSRARRGTVTAADDASPAPVPHRPANIVAAAPEPEAEAPPKTPTSVKKAPAPTSVKKSPAAKSSTLSPKPPVRKPSNSSLTQAKAKSDAASAKTKSPQPKPTRPRSPTRATKASSHLTAPTAASAARQDSQSSKPSVSVSKPAVNSRPPPRAPAAAATKPIARSSLASTSNAPKKTDSKPATSSKGSDDSFLARMMRPTASSASKAHEKTEAKSPPKRTPSVIRSKVPPKPKTGKVERTKSSTSVEKTEEAAGASTPQAAASDQGHENTGLEATPAFDTATIR